MILAKPLPPTHHNTKYDLKNYVGWKIGEFYVTGNWRKKGGEMQWEKQCSCGSEPIYDRAANVVNGKAARCKKCSMASRADDIRGSLSPCWKGVGEIPSTFLAQVRRSAKRRGITVEITLEELNTIWIKQRGFCVYTGVPLDFLSSGKEQTASLDRIDSDKGYTSGNVQFVHKDVNLMKQALTEDRFLELCKTVTEYHG